MKKIIFLLPLFLIAPFWSFAEQQPDSIASAEHPNYSLNTGAHGAGALPEIYGLRNDWMNEFSGKKSDTLKKGNAFYEINLIQWMPPGCPSCRKALPKACL